MFTASEDGFVKVWDVRARGCQREYESRAPINTAVLHPNQGELITGACLARQLNCPYASLLADKVSQDRCSHDSRYITLLG